MQFRTEVDEDFDLLSVSVQFITGSSIDSSRVFCKRNVCATCFFHVGSAGNQLLNVEPGNSNRQQTDRSQYRETSAYIIGDDECFVTFLVGSNTCCTFLGVCYSYDYLFCSFFAALVFALFLQQAEGKRSFGSSSRFGDIDNTEFLVFQILSQFE